MMNVGTRSFGADPKTQNALKCFDNRRDRRPRLSASIGLEVEILAEFP